MARGSRRGARESRRGADAMMERLKDPNRDPRVALWPYAWLVLFFLVPFFIVLKISLSQSTLTQPPYAPLLDWDAGWQGLKDFFAALSFDNYASLAVDALYRYS